MLHQESDKYNHAHHKLNALLDRLHYQGPRSQPQYMCRCPAHDDHNPSLSVTLTAEGKILLHCFAGCESRAVLAAIGLTWRDLMAPLNTQPQATQPPATKPTPSAPPSAFVLKQHKKGWLGAIVATYNYCDAAGSLVCQVVRYEPKSFRQRQRVNDDWVWSMQGVNPPLYCLPELLAAPTHEWVFIVEGEKDVDTLRALGLVATCNIQGANKWKPTYNQWLTNRRVCILPDNDDPGRQHAQSVADHLTACARQVQLLPLPNLPEKGDVSDWLAAGGDAQKLVALLNQAVSERWLPPADQGADRNNSYVNMEGSMNATPSAKPKDDHPLLYLREHKSSRRITSGEYLEALYEKLHYTFASNELDDTVEVNGEPMDDILYAVIRSKMRDLGYTDMKALEDAYTANAARNQYHPVKRYLQGLTWDGKNHLDQLAAHLQDDHPPITYASRPNHDPKDDPSHEKRATVAHHGDKCAPVAKVWLLRFLVGAVARVYDHKTIPAQPPMLVLDGQQGLGKSTFVRWLGSPLPDLTCERSINPDYKEMPRLQATKWIWEVAELGATMRRADREALKAIISTGDVTFRVPFYRHFVRKPTLANFIGTINNEAGFLSDPTGNRRFLAMTLTHIDHAYAKEVDIKQLWAQIYALYQQGEPWQLLPPEREMQTRLNQAYQQEDPFEAWVLLHYECDPSHSAQYQRDRNQGWFVTTQEIAAHLTSLGFVGTTISLQQHLATTLKAMGLQAGRMEGARGLRGYYGLRRLPKTQK